MKSLKDLLPKTFHPGVIKQMHATALVEAGQRAIDELLPGVASMIVVKYMKDKTLYIGVASSALVTALKLNEQKIIKRIEALVRKTEVIEKIYTRID